MEDTIIDLAFGAMPLLLIGAIAAQWLALRRFRGAWLVAAWVPAAVMGAALTIAILGVIAGSNIAPIWVVFALPPCLLWLTVLWLLRGLAALTRA